MRLVILLLSLVVLSACQQLSTEQLLEQHREAQLRLANLKQTATPSPQQASAISYSDEFFVPPLDERHALLPDWSAKRVSITAQGLAAGHLLEQVFGNSSATVRFSRAQLAQTEVFIQFEGSIAELMLKLASRFRWHLQWSSDTVVVHEFEVAEFDVAFIAGDTSYFLGNRDRQQQTQLSNNDALSATAISNQSEQFLNFSSDDLSVWHDLEQAVSMLLSEHGQMTINQSSTSILVRDYPQQVAQVRAYLAQQNERLTRQVVIDVQIVEVTFTDEQQFSIDWDAVVSTAGGEGVLGFASAQLNQLNGGQMVWQQQSGKATGSQILIDALEQQGLVTTSNHPRVVSLNNQIAKIVLEDNATYLAAAGSSATANVGRADILQPGVVTTGFELYLLPSIRHGEVILQLSTELSDLERIDEVRSGEQMIQTPHTNRKKFFMKALVEHGQTLLMSGLKNERQQNQRQQSWLSLLLGGGQKTGSRRSETLVLLTPHIVARGNRS
jgi:type IVB pilus formation R64 PilN family outer membrane protein